MFWSALNKLLSGKGILTLCGFVFLLCLFYRILVLFFPHPDSGGVEGNVAYFIQRILDGQLLYSDPEQPPYAIAQYSPVYYFLVAGVARIVGIGPDEVFSVFVTGRVVSLALNLCFAGIIYLLCRKVYAVPFRRSLLAGMLSFIFLQITSFARPDSLYHVCFALTLYCFLRAAGKGEEKSYDRKFLFLSALLAAFTLFTKQTAIVLPLLFGACFLYEKKYREMGFFSIIYLLSVAVFTGTVLLFEDPGAFFKNTIQGINNGISFSWYRDNFINDFYRGFALLLLPAFIGVLFISSREKNRLAKLSGILVFLLFVLLNGLSLKIGSVHGYLTEWWTFLFVLLAWYWPLIVQTSAGLDKRIPAAVVCLVLLLQTARLVTPVVQKAKAITSPAWMQPYYKEEKVARMVTARLENGETFTVFTNFYTPYNFIGNFLFRHAVMPQMEIVLLSTYPRKKFDYSGFFSRLQNGNIKWMLMRVTDPQQQFYGISLDQYELVEAREGFNLYRYKPR